MGFESSLRAVYGRPTGTGMYTDFLQLNVATVSSAMAALQPGIRRNSELYQFGVMGIITRKGDTMPSKFVKQIMVRIATRPKVRATPIDALVVEALNASLGADEVIQLYPHASLNELGDTDARVDYFAKLVSRSIVLPITEK